MLLFDPEKEEEYNKCVETQKTKREKLSQFFTMQLCKGFGLGLAIYAATTAYYKKIQSY